MDDLTLIYNQARSDYLIPMPMNRRKLQDYVHNYDIDLRRSRVALLEGKPAGLIMFGQRDQCGWISRLGVYPDARVAGVGRALVERVIDDAKKPIDSSVGHASAQSPCDEIIIEVIDKNVPALRLFAGVGFEPLRDLLVTRRPPKPVDFVAHGAEVEMLGSREALALLNHRSDRPSWVTDTASMNHAGNIAGMMARWPDGTCGWLVYQCLAYTLSRLVIHTEEGNPERVGRGLLQQLHWRHPLQDTTCENMSIHDAHWPAMCDMGYLVAFVRREMCLPLRPDEQSTPKGSSKNKR
jgi:GNAT superfamily N-acetyltransferase